MDGNFTEPGGPAGPAASSPGWMGRFGLRLPWWVGRPAGGPVWAWRAAVGVTGALLLVPLLLVMAAVLVAVLGVIVAILAGMLTFMLASALARLLDVPGWLGRRTPLPDDGRRNVRVLRPEESEPNLR